MAFNLRPLSSTLALLRNDERGEEGKLSGITERIEQTLD
jgi:hypothetical protein